MEHRLLLIVFLLCAFLSSATLSGMVIPRILSRSIRKGRCDKPDYRKMHKGYASRLGGVSFLPEMLFSIALVVAFYFLSEANDFFTFSSIPWPRWLFLLVAAGIIYATGVIDDLRTLNYRIKLIALLAASVCVVASGLHFQNLGGLLFLNTLPFWLDTLITILFFIGIVVAVNLIDGIDGLASGLSSIMLIYYGSWFIILGQYSYALGVFALLGVIVPFFFYNTYKKTTRHRIFMGDAGSMTLGMSLALCALFFLESNTGEASDVRLIGAVAPLFIPCFDALRVFAFRMYLGVSPFHPDMNHLHHKLVKIYNSQNIARRIILLVAICYLLSNLVLSRFVNVNLLILADAVLYILWNISLTKRIKKQK